MTALVRSILGSLIMNPGLLEAVSISEADFPPGREREVFQAITEIWKTDRLPEIPVDLLAERINGANVASFIASFIHGNIVLKPAAFSAEVNEFRKINVSTKIVQLARTLAEEHLKTGAWDDEGFRQLLKLLEKRNEGPEAGNVLNQLISGAELQMLKDDTTWLVEKLIPGRSITLLHGPGGLGKTWFALNMANAVSCGTSFLGLTTDKRPVCFIDFENPRPLLIDRAKKLDIKDVLFWHLSANCPPPKLDTSAHLLYRQLPAESLIIFDTLRAAHDGDENSSQDMALVMGRLKELRERGFDIFLIHHTSKTNERQYKGSTAISDLADHVLRLYKGQKGSLKEIQDDAELDSDSAFVLATGKTRFEPSYLFLSFSPTTGGFSVAKDPDLETLEALSHYIAGAGQGRNQTDMFEWVKQNVGGCRKQNLIALLNRGEREGRWRSHLGFKGAKLYEPKSCP